MDIKKDMKNIKDDVVKGASKLGNAVKHTAKETIEVGNKRIDLLKKYKLI